MEFFCSERELQVALIYLINLLVFKQVCCWMYFSFSKLFDASSEVDKLLLYLKCQTKHFLDDNDMASIHFFVGEEGMGGDGWGWWVMWEIR